jgi:transposase InsO family protein
LIWWAFVGRFRSTGALEAISFRLLYGLLILRHDRRRILWMGVTAHPTAEWVTRQLIEACGWERVPKYILRDRDRAYGDAFRRRVRAMGIRDRPTSSRSPWQNAYAERLIGSIRRECVDHVVVLGERHFRHVLLSYMNELLQRDPNALVVGQGRADSTCGAGRWPNSTETTSRWTAPPIRPDLISGRDTAGTSLISCARAVITRPAFSSTSAACNSVSTRTSTTR